ncbi:MAG: VanZ family protein [Gemmatimonadales bacterium]
MAVILLATLYPTSGPLPAGWSLTFATGPAPAAEIVQNLLLFIPLGAALVLAGVRPFPTILIGTALSLGVELAQQWIPGRDPSLGDIVCNTASTALGAWLGTTAPRWVTVPPTQAAWQSLAAAIAAAALWIGLGLALDPDQRLGEGWTIVFFSRRIPHWTVGLLNVTWIGAGWLAVAFWTRRHPASAAALALLTLATLAGPYVANLQPNHGLEIAAAIAGLAAGAALRSWLARRP